MGFMSKHSLMLGTNSELKKNVRKEARSTNKLRQSQTKFLHPLSVKIGTSTSEHALQNMP